VAAIAEERRAQEPVIGEGRVGATEAALKQSISVGAGAQLRIGKGKGTGRRSTVDRLHQQDAVRCGLSACPPDIGDKNARGARGGAANTQQVRWRAVSIKTRVESDQAAWLECVADGVDREGAERCPRRRSAGNVQRAAQREVVHSYRAQYSALQGRARIGGESAGSR